MSSRRGDKLVESLIDSHFKIISPYYVSVGYGISEDDNVADTSRTFSKRPSSVVTRHNEEGYWMELTSTGQN
ncbi:unnamed protein product [Phytophthora fragariaefolia]|uniref:Unnamed protein product n=1 Tax=Phytophthora fragariaefolia TaxID=1490495 RepID=A0A9W6Y2R3_9STRA|nr:unnamed protein product [Phytophthora fragariaefolia]